VISPQEEYQQLPCANCRDASKLPMCKFGCDRLEQSSRDAAKTRRKTLQQSPCVDCRDIGKLPMCRYGCERLEEFRRSAHKEHFGDNILGMMFLSGE